jgi:hypothetical protein
LFRVFRGYVEIVETKVGLNPITRQPRGVAAAKPFAIDDNESSPASDPTTSRAARLLALAHRVERLHDTRAVADFAAAARLLGITRARMTQLMNLLLLSPLIQERVLTQKSHAMERALRAVSSEPEWHVQLEEFQRCCPSEP